MPTGEFYLEHIEKEVRDAVEARRKGVEGRARVCARRGAGYAAAWLYTSRGQAVQDTESLNLLKTLERDESIPEEVRTASKRLTARVTPDFAYAFSTDPLNDAKIIIDYVRRLLS